MAILATSYRKSYLKKQNDKTPFWTKKRLIWAASIFLCLGGATLGGYWYANRPVVDENVNRVAAMMSSQFESEEELTDEQRKEIRDKIRKEMESLSDQQRRALWGKMSEAAEQRAQKIAHSYAQTPPEQREAFLDREIERQRKQFSRMRASWAGGGGPGGGPGGAPGGPSGSPGRPPRDRGSNPGGSGERSWRTAGGGDKGGGSNGGGANSGSANGSGGNAVASNSGGGQPGGGPGGGGPGGGPGGRGPGGPGGDRNTRLVNYLNSSTPQSRAEQAQYLLDLKNRMVEQGMRAPRIPRAL